MSSRTSAATARTSATRRKLFFLEATGPHFREGHSLGKAADHSNLRRRHGGNWTPLFWVESMGCFPFGGRPCLRPATRKRFLQSLALCGLAAISAVASKNEPNLKSGPLVVVRGFYVPDRPVVACRLIVAPAIPVAAVAVVVIMVTMLSAAAGLCRSRKQRKGAHDRGHRKCK